MSKNKSAQAPAPANGAEETAAQNVPVSAKQPASGQNLGQILDDQGLTELIGELISNEGDQEQATAPPVEGEPEPNADAETASAEETAEATDNENEDLSQSEEAEESQDDDADETADEEEEDAHDDVSEGVKKRFAKLTAKRREAESALRDTQERVEQLQAELQELKGKSHPPAQPTADNPFAGLETQAEVDGEVHRARQVRRWCEENPDGVVVTGSDGKEVEYTAEQIRRIKLNAIDAIEQHLPARRAYIQQAQEFDKAALDMFPWWKDRSSAQRQQAEEILAQAPELKRFPNYRVFLGDYLLGVAYRAKMAQDKAAPKKRATVKRAPSQPTKPTPQRAPAEPSKVKAEKAREVFRTTQTDRDLHDVVLTNFI